MKKLLLLMMVCAGCLKATAQSGHDIIGKWMNEDKNCAIEIYNRNNKAYGRIVWLRDSVDVFGEVRRDIYNENPSLRSRKLVGIDLLVNMEYDGSRKWADGNVYHFDNGNTYNAKVFIDDQGVLHIKGYWWFFSFLGRTQLWHRVNHLP